MDDGPQRGDAPEPTTGEVPMAVPPVGVVLVAHDPGPWFEETLGTLAEQTYQDLSVVVVDTDGATEVSPRVEAVLPGATVLRLDHDPGFGAAANEGVDQLGEVSFLLLCHDDIALEPDTVRALVEEAFRSNAGIIGPKLVEWDDPRRLLQVGMGADKTGALAPITERHELDQEQHDAVRDVFVVPGACTLMRADLFAAIGGFDEGIVGPGDDLDLCWRTHTVGARVLIGPAARVRHLEARGLRVEHDDRRRRLARHRLRTSLVAYRPFHRWRVLPQAALLTLIEAIYGVLAGHPGRAADVFAAWPWNLRRAGQIRSRRRQLKAARRVGDSEVRGLQVRGSARISAFLRGQAGPDDDRVTSLARSSRNLFGSMQDSSRRVATTLAAVVVLFLLVGSRDLVTHAIPAVGEFSPFPSPRSLASAWWSGWHRNGLGAAEAQPTGSGLLAVAGYLFLGATGLLRTVLVLGMVPLGALGAWRMARPIGSTRASVTAFAVYLAIPVPYNALARGSWSGLLVYALSPWLLLTLGRASGLAPFGPKLASDGEPARRRRRLVELILGTGLALALVAAVVPFVLVVALGLGLCVAVGSLLCFRVAGVARVLAATVGSVLVAVVLHIPWSLDLLHADSPWEALAGLGSPDGGPLRLGRILRFETGPWGAPPLGWAFLLAGALPLLIGRSWRLEWAVRAWVVVLAGWAVLWAGQSGRLPVGLPAAEVMLAPVAAALALTAALGLRAFEVDLRSYRMGWRQLVAVAAALGVILGALPLGSGLIDGRWKVPSRDDRTSLNELIGKGGPPFRVVWVGEPQVLPAAGWRYDRRLAYATTDRGVASVLDRFTGPPPGATPLVADALHLAQDRRTTRLGRLLAPFGARYLVVQTRTVEGRPSSASDALTEQLSQQLDLEQVPVAEGMVVYRNTSWAPTRSVLPEGTGTGDDLTDAARDDLRDAVPALVSDRGNADAVGTVPAEGRTLVSVTSDPRWRLRIGGVAMARTKSYGWATSFDATRTGRADLTYRTPVSHRLASLGQLGLWVVVILGWRILRRRDRRAGMEAVS